MSKWETLDPRRAGELKRYHTWPCLRQQTNAEHMWNVVRLVLAIWPDAPRSTLIYALMHDVGEVATGDLPYPTKKNDPELKARLDKAEKSAHLSMCKVWNLPPPRELPEHEKLIVKIADYMDMWEYALGEVASGNACHNIVVRRCSIQINTMIPELTQETRHRVISYMANREKIHRRMIRGEE